MARNDDKEALRRQHLRARGGLPPDRCREWNARIRLRLLSFFPPRNSADVLTYVSSKDNEVDTLAIISELLERGIRVLVPVAVSPAIGLSWSLLRDLNHLAPSRFGILEPVPAMRQEMPPPPHSPCLVPGIAFDANGHRIGYGGGYFDRFLARHTGAKIGLAYEMQIAADLPHRAHDVPMDCIVTEERIYSVTRTTG